MNNLALIFCQHDDKFIWLLAVVNLVLFCITVYKIKKANDVFQPRIDKVNGVNVSMEWNNNQIKKLKKSRSFLIFFYTGYANITAIFPLLGILGTVAALVTYSNETMMDNFMIALGTTLFGVLFAIIFKFLDTFISAPLDSFLEDTDHVIREFDRRKEAQG